MSHTLASRSPLAARLDAVRAKKAERDSGFTLIELLVVVVIIGILVAIAIPLYLQYQNGAKNKSAESDLRGAISTVETYYGDNSNKYPVATDVTKTAGNVAFGSANARLSDGNSLNYVPNTAAAPTSYKLCTWNSSGKHWFRYNSADGGSVKDMGTTDTLPATCEAPTP